MAGIESQRLFDEPNSITSIEETDGSKSLYPTTVQNALESMEKDQRHFKPITLMELKQFHGLPKLVRQLSAKNPHRTTYLRFHPKTGSISGFIPTPALLMVYGAKQACKFPKQLAKYMDEGDQFRIMDDIKPSNEELYYLGDQVLRTLIHLFKLCSQLNRKIWSDFSIPKPPKNGEQPNTGENFDDDPNVKIFYDPSELEEGKAVDWIFVQKH